MGVDLLLSLMRAEGLLKPAPIFLNDTNIYVDAGPIFHAFGPNPVLTIEGGFAPVTRQFVMYGTQAKSSGYNPVFIFDGSRPDEKDEENDERDANRDRARRAWVLIFLFYQSGEDVDRDKLLAIDPKAPSTDTGAECVKAMDNYAKASYQTTVDVIISVVRALENAGFQTIIGAEEYDIYLRDHPGIAATIDSDLIVHGCSFLNIRRSSGGVMWPNEWATSEIEFFDAGQDTALLGDTPIATILKRCGIKGFRVIASILGSDYSKKALKGIGVEALCVALSKLPGLEDVVDSATMGVVAGSLFDEVKDRRRTTRKSVAHLTRAEEVSRATLAYAAFTRLSPDPAVMPLEDVEINGIKGIPRAYKSLYVLLKESAPRGTKTKIAEYIKGPAGGQVVLLSKQTERIEVATEPALQVDGEDESDAENERLEREYFTIHSNTKPDKVVPVLEGQPMTEYFIDRTAVDGRAVDGSKAWMRGMQAFNGGHVLSLTLGFSEPGEAGKPYFGPVVLSAKCKATCSSETYSVVIRCRTARHLSSTEGDLRVSCIAEIVGAECTCPAGGEGHCTTVAAVLHAYKHYSEHLVQVKPGTKVYKEAEGVEEAHVSTTSIACYWKGPSSSDTVDSRVEMLKDMSVIDIDPLVDIEGANAIDTRKRGLDPNDGGVEAVRLKAKKARRHTRKSPREARIARYLFNVNGSLELKK